MARNFFIVGNWKMNPATIAEAREIFDEIRKPATRTRRAKVIIAPPAIFLENLAAKKSPIFFAAQDVSSEISGAHTGEISAKMAKSVGAKFGIVGHSERRAKGDSDEIIAEKFVRLTEVGIVPILCIGEKKRDASGDYFSEIERSLSVVIKKFAKIRVPSFIVAYEPVWAVGGAYNNALSSEEMRSMAIFIKKICSQYMPKEKAMRVRVLYGGSVSVDNAQDMLINGGIDGLLIGRQSLDPKSFTEIIKIANV